MKFISKLPMLKVVLTAPRRLTDPYSGNMGTTIPGSYAQFKNGHFETTDASSIRVMVEKFYVNKQRNMTQTFWPHPEDTAHAAKLWERIQETGHAAEGMVMDKDDALRQALAENDRLHRELDQAKKLGNIKRQTKMKSAVVEIPEKANQPALEPLDPDDVDDSEAGE